MTQVLEGKPPARALTLGSRLFRPTSHHSNAHVLAFLALTPRRTWVAVRLQYARTVSSGPQMREAATLPAPRNATCGLSRSRPPSMKAVPQLFRTGRARLPATRQGSCWPPSYPSLRDGAWTFDRRPVRRAAPPHHLSAARKDFSFNDNSTHFFTAPFRQVPHRLASAT